MIFDIFHKATAEKEIEKKFKKAVDKKKKECIINICDCEILSNITV